MGQASPFPKHIPVPNDDIRELMIAKGFTIGDTIDFQGIPFVTYTMPEGWKFIDNSEYPIPCRWEFVCPDGLVHFLVEGTWSGICGKELALSALMNPTEFKPVEKFYEQRIR